MQFISVFFDIEKFADLLWKIISSLSIFFK